MSGQALYEIGAFVDVIGRPVSVVAPLKIAKCWYALRLHPGRERKVRHAFTERAVNCYLPTFIRTLRVGRWRLYTRPRTRRIEMPLFPGLIFVPDYEAGDIDRLKAMIDGIAGLLKFGEFDAKLTLDDIDAIRELERVEGLAVSVRRRHARLIVGNEVVITDNASPFWMWKGRIGRLDAKGRIRVLLSAVTREIPVSLSEDQVEPA